MDNQPDIQIIWNEDKTLINGTSMLTIYLLLSNCALVALLLPKNVNSTRNSVFRIFCIVFIGILSVVTILQRYRLPVFLFLVAYHKLRGNFKLKFKENENDDSISQFPKPSKTQKTQKTINSRKQSKIRKVLGANDSLDIKSPNHRDDICFFDHPYAAKTPQTHTTQLPSLTILRIACMLITIIAILAVDFPSIFPREFSKTDQYGYSLMDTGVGILIFGMGAAFGLSKREKSSRSDFVQFVFVLIIGVARAIVITYLSQNDLYRFNENEYGRHWNFFLTVAVIKLLNEGLLRGKTGVSWLVFGFFSMVFYEFHLQNGLELAMMKNDHIGDHDPEISGLLNFLNSFYVANQEGICSCIGYFCLSVGSAAFTKIFMSDENDSKTDQFRKLVKIWCFWTLSNIFAPGNASRRLANTKYVVWIFALCYYCWLMVFVITQHIQTVPKIFEKLNKHQMGAFLVSNILTGAVNSGMNTLECGPVQAFIVMVIYLMVVAGFLWTKI